MLERDILEQVKGVFADLSATYVFDAAYNRGNEHADEFVSFLSDVASCSPKLSCYFAKSDEQMMGFRLLRDGNDTGIRFRGIPNGHEFTSLLLAVINADGKGKNLPDEAIRRRIGAIKGNVDIKTYVSLTCTNCPDVVQALNIMALYNPNIKHEMVDGALFQDEISKLNIQGVPSVFVNGEPFHTGRGDLGELLSKLEERQGTTANEHAKPVERTYDVVVLGGGPAGTAVAIYSARKGLRVAMVAERIGGQVKDTVGIENLISVPQTTGAKLADDLKTHLGNYPVEVFENRRISAVNLKEKMKRIGVKGGEEFMAPAVIIATGAGWRRLNVDEEARYIGHGVHFCPHCDGPFYKNKRVAVVGGGNSGIEAAIDLAGICSHVTVLEFANELRADNVLQEKARSMKNVEIFTSQQTTRVIGDGTKVTALQVKDRKTDKERKIELDGVFVQIGLVANTEPFSNELQLTERREIPVDEYCRTAIKGVYAAGDVSNVPYKQIVIAMGEGAKAALSAFEDRMRGVI